MIAVTNTIVSAKILPKYRLLPSGPSNELMPNTEHLLFAAKCPTFINDRQRLHNGHPFISTISLVMTRTAFLLSLIVFAVSCNNDKTSLSPGQIAGIRDSVQLMTVSIARDLSRNGPAAWLHYFENTKGFFMASDGQLIFPGIDTAKNFINNILVKNISAIDLRWNNIRVDPLTAQLASIAADFHEDVTDSDGKIIRQDGYFTGIAHQTPGGWKLYNAHWSSRLTH